jgi:hypothetical protein
MEQHHLEAIMQTNNTKLASFPKSPMNRQELAQAIKETHPRTGEKIRKSMRKAELEDLYRESLEAAEKDRKFSELEAHRSLVEEEYGSIAPGRDSYHQVLGERWEDTCNLLNNLNHKLYNWQMLAEETSRTKYLAERFKRLRKAREDGDELVTQQDLDEALEILLGFIRMMRIVEI